MSQYCLLITARVRAATFSKIGLGFFVKGDLLGLVIGLFTLRCNLLNYIGRSTLWSTFSPSFHKIYIITVKDFLPKQSVNVVMLDAEPD